MKSPIFATVLLASLLSLTLASTAISPLPISCAVVLCAADTRCIETERGPQCVPVPIFPPPKPTSCAVILCIEGTRCVEGPNGAECVPITQPPPTDPQPPSDCSTLDCPNGEICIETPGGPQCTPDTGCAAVTCVVGSRCVETPEGPRCVSDPLPPDSCACIKIYDPVCCRFRNGDVRTVGNSCECTGCNSGNQIVAPSPCAPPSCALVDCAPGFKCVERDGAAQCVEIDSCVCPEIFDPVCCRTASGIETKSNACFCTCEPSGKVLFNRKCPGRRS